MIPEPLAIPRHRARGVLARKNVDATAAAAAAHGRAFGANV
jgi:hypothetical protein